MIAGLEYEQQPSNDGGGADRSPSAASMNSVDISSPQPQPQYNNNNSYLNSQQQLHRRRPHSTNGSNGYNNDLSNRTSYNEDNKYNKVKIVRKLDIFPKTEREMTVRTEQGGQLTAVGYVIMTILLLAEWLTWRSMNGTSLEHTVVDTR